MKSLLLILILSVAVFAQVPPMIPNTYVQDHANVLTPGDEQILQDKLTELKQKHNIEFGVVTLQSLDGRDIKQVSLDIARNYGVGSKSGEKRGLLLLVTVQDRKWRFEISRHMEGAFTDSQSATVARLSLVPGIKKAIASGQSAEWRDAFLNTVAATDAEISRRIEPEQTAVGIAAPAPNNTTTWGTIVTVAGMLFFGTIGLFWLGFRKLFPKETTKQPSVIPKYSYAGSAGYHNYDPYFDSKPRSKPTPGTTVTPPAPKREGRKAHKPYEPAPSYSSRKERSDDYYTPTVSTPSYSSSYGSSSSSSSSSSDSSSSSFGGGGDFSGGGSDGSF